MPDCQPCKERGRITPGERLVGGEWMCQWCFAGYDGPDDPRVHSGNSKLNRSISPTGSAVGAVHEPPNRENPMSARKEIDLKAFKADYEAGILGKELEKKYGLGTNTTSFYAHKAGATMRRRGSSPNGNKPDTRPLQKLQRKAAKLALDQDGAVVTLCLTAQALDAIWARLKIETKAQLIEALAAD